MKFNTQENYYKVNGITMFTELLGRGEPLLMIPGLSAANWLWFKSANPLSKHYKLIMPELRGSGRSDKPDEHYTIPLFAKDLNHLLNHLNINKIHLLGISMGGFVAQYFSYKWPDSVSSLILACTTLGGQDQIGPSGEILSRLIRPHGRSRKERLEYYYAFNFTHEFMNNHPEELEKITEMRINYPQPEYAYYRQFFAGIAYSGKKYAAKITAPTLILTGKDDEIVSVENAYALNETIPDSRVQICNGKHLFFYEHYKQFNTQVNDFLGERSIN